MTGGTRWNSNPGVLNTNPMYIPLFYIPPGHMIFQTLLPGFFQAFDHSDLIFSGSAAIIFHGIHGMVYDI